MPMYSVSQLIASASVNIPLMGDGLTVAVPFAAGSDIDAVLARLRSDDQRRQKHLVLHFENITGNDLQPVIDVYVNLEKENVPVDTNYIGSLALYGLGEASIATEGQDVHGLQYDLDVREIFAGLRSLPNWSHDQFRITLVPRHSVPADARLVIGRITLYYYES